MSYIEHKSIISSRDGKPYVQVRINEGSTTAQVQLAPEDAREQASLLMRAADAAESDAFVLAFAKEQLHISDETVLIQLLAAFRKFRETQEFTRHSTKVTQ